MGTKCTGFDSDASCSRSIESEIAASCKTTRKRFSMITFFLKKEKYKMNKTHDTTLFLLASCNRVNLTVNTFGW